MKKFPKTIYVTRDTESDEQYLAIRDDEGGVPDVDETTPVGIYQLVETAEIVVTREVKKKATKKAR